MSRIILFYFIVSVFSFVACQPGGGRQQLLDVGIPEQMAEYRSKQLSDIHYDLAFVIPDDHSQAIAAHLALEVTVHALDQPLFLDFNADSGNLMSLTVNDGEVAINHEKGHLIIAPEELKDGVNTVDIEFIAGQQSLNRNADFLYTLLVPDRASTLFPCFDQPDLKATYQLTVTAPTDWEVLTTTWEESRTDTGGAIEHRFGKTDKISTYLFSFVAGKFSVADQTLGDMDMRFLYRENDEGKVQASLDPVFSLHRQALDFMEAYTAYPFPFQKLDFAAIPIFQYGGMEHVGAIQYRESSLFLDETATATQKLGRAKLIAHETAHMWFGDLVTMAWFNDVWLKEVFANFMADKLVNPVFPDINHALSFAMTHYPAAYAEDRTKGTNPIRQQLANLKDAGSMYGNIIYNKAPIMMRQLEKAVGEDNFRAGIQAYIKQYAYGNAEWADLIAILDEKTDVDLKAWSEVWVNQSSRPVFEADVRYDGQGTIESFTLAQHAEDGSSHVWPQQFSVALVYADRVVEIPVDMTGKELSIAAAVGAEQPQSIIYNYDGLGYGVFPVAPEAVKILAAVEDAVARGYGYINCYEQMLNGNYPVQQFLEEMQLALGDESNELILDYMTGRLGSVFWMFLSDDSRAVFQQQLEPYLFGLLQAEGKSANLKKSLFRLYRSVAYTGEGRERLYRVWDKTLVFPGLKLNDDDFTGIAMDLAVYEHPQSSEILERAKTALTNPDEQARFAFLQPALSSDTAVRNEFFLSMKEAKNREKESWVVTAMNYLHHPLRQEATVAHIGLALDLLQEIQQTGDIFFPKQWLVATIGQYRLPSAYAVLREFIDQHPDYSPILMRKVLQATDNLERAQNL